MKHIQIIPFNENSIIIKELNENGIIWAIYDSNQQSISQFIFNSIEIKSNLVLFNDGALSINVDTYNLLMKQRGFG